MRDKVTVNSTEQRCLALALVPVGILQEHYSDFSLLKSSHENSH